MLSVSHTLGKHDSCLEASINNISSNRWRAWGSEAKSLLHILAADAWWRHVLSFSLFVCLIQAFVSSLWPSLLKILSLRPVEHNYVKQNVSGKKLQVRDSILDLRRWLSSTGEHFQVSKDLPKSRELVQPHFSLIGKSASHTTLGGPVIARKPLNDCQSFAEVGSHEFHAVKVQ